MSGMEYRPTETNENKPLEKNDISTRESEAVRAFDSTGGISDAGRNGFDDGNVDLSRTNIPEWQNEQSDSKVELVNGRMPLNCEYAGKTYPVEKLSPELQEKYPQSADFNEQGFPDFSPYKKAEVQIEYTGNRMHDFKLANKAAGYEKTPEGYTWHHHQDAKTMQLVPTDIHDEVKHTGGCATSGLDYNKRK